MSKPKPIYRPRLSVEITQEQAALIRKYVGWGQQRKIFSNLLDCLLTCCETDLDATIRAFTNNQLTVVPTTMLKELKDAQTT